MKLGSAKVLCGMLAVATVFSISACAKRDPLLEPDPAAVVAAAPDSFDVLFETSKGNFTVRAHRDWAPNGVDRFHYLVSHGYYDDARFFRAINGFMAQFGLHARPEVTAVWQEMRIPPDSVRMGNTRGRVSYAMGRSPDTRTTQLFINFGDNSRLDATGFAAFAEVISGMDVVDMINTEHGEMPNQGSISTSGNEYLDSEFPNLDYIKTARIIK
jgi:peptidyl-prolyl cis-trans isomerase A (cyclophilin A)